GLHPSLSKLPDSAIVASRQDIQKRAHISPLPTGERGRGRGPEISDQHGTSDGPDHLRPLPNPLPRRERELFRRGLIIQRWSKDCTLLYLNYQTAQSLPPGRIFKNEHISPLSLLGRGAG